jgi:flagellar FliL protein
MAVEKDVKPRASIMGNMLRVVTAIVLITLLMAGVSYVVASKVLVSAGNGAMAATKTTITHPAGEYLTNLSDKGYIKFSMVYLLDGKETQKEVEEKDSEIRDSILLILRGKRLAEVKDSQGMEDLRMEIKHSINSILERGEVRDIYFTSILVN